MVELRRFWEDIFPYHLITSTRHRIKLLDDPEKAEFIRDFLLEARRRDDIMLLAYCIMPDHVHLLVVPRRKNLSIFMMGLKTMTANRFKLGKVWERRFFDKKLETMDELRHTVDYIHGNPVRDRMVQEPEHYEFSSASNWESLDLHVFLEFGPDV